MTKAKKAAPKAPAKKVTINPNKKEAGRELGDAELRKVSGGLRSRLAACTCSNMPSDPTT